MATVVPDGARDGLAARAAARASEQLTPQERAARIQAAADSLQELVRQMAECPDPVAQQMQVVSARLDSLEALARKACRALEDLAERDGQAAAPAADAGQDTARRLEQTRRDVAVMAMNIQDEFESAAQRLEAAVDATRAAAPAAPALGGRGPAARPGPAAAAALAVGALLGFTAGALAFSLIS